MTYQEGNVGDLVQYTPPIATIGDITLGQIVGGDGMNFRVNVLATKPYSGMNNPVSTLWLIAQPQTYATFLPQYTIKK